MREIKFRAWLPKPKGDNTMRYKISVGGKDIDDLDAFFRDTANDGCVWMLYTGLKDKNGKEIFEGDIFLIKSGDGQKHYTKVVYNAPSFDLEDKKGDVCWNIYIVVTNGEVIGNIYENPELLK